MSETKPDPDAMKASTTSPAQAEETPKDAAPAATSYTEMASNAAGSATTAAAGVKDSVFSMFGGGVKKERREEPHGEVEDRSGSSKAKKEAEAAEAEEGGEVGFPLSALCSDVLFVTTTQGADSGPLCCTGRRPGFPRCPLRARRALDRKGGD